MKFWRQRKDEELDAEIRHHLNEAIRNRLERGETPDEARANALREFGNVGLVKEVTREMWGSRFAERLGQDLRFGMRMLHRNPGFSLIAILTLALGIGANTAIFSVVNAVLLRPLPYAEPERLVWVWGNVRGGGNRASLSPADFLAYRAGSQSFQQLGGFMDQSDFATLTGGGEPERLRVNLVTANFFDVLGVKPLLGQGFSAEDEQQGRGLAVMLSHALWQRRFGGDASLIGKTLTLNGQSAAVAGVLPADFEPPLPAEFWSVMPLSMMATVRRAYFIRPVGRLQPDITIQQAQAEVDGIARRLEESYIEAKNWSLRLVPLREQMSGSLKPFLLLSLGAVGFVLLIACANVASLMLARAATRKREITVRAALGASRWRIVRQLLAESFLLALAGGALGALLGVWLVKGLVAISAGNLPTWARVAIDWRVLGFTLAATGLTGLLFGLAPAWQVSRPNLVEALKDGGHGASDGRHQQRLRAVWVVGEIALAVVLLIGAGLLVRSFLRLLQVHPGFVAENVSTTPVELSPARYKPGQAENFWDQLQQRLTGQPGVTAVGMISILPMSGQANVFRFRVAGRPQFDGNVVNADYRQVNHDYFRALQIPLLRGRSFAPEEARASRPVIIISASFAERFFPNENPLGQHLLIHSGIDSGSAELAYEIIGVTGDIRHRGLSREVFPMMYAPMLRRYGMTLVVRTAAPMPELARLVRQTVRTLDPDAPLAALRPLTEVVGDSIAQQRLNTLLLGALAALALTLAAVGVYGVMSYTVMQRTHEIGIRMALGAQPGDVARLVLRQGCTLTLAGVGFGLVTALALTRWMQNLLFNVAPTDHLTFAGVASLLTFVALLACWLPARRATKVDPLVALRSE